MVKQRSVSVLLLTLFLGGFPGVLFSQGQERTKVAVLELDPIGVSATVSLTITESLRDYLRSFGHLEVMGRELMTQTLREKAPDKTSPFTEEKEILEVGRIIGVKKVVAGSISKIGDLHVISLKSYDTASGEGHESSKTSTGSLNDFLATALREAADELFPLREQTFEIAGFIRAADGRGLANVAVFSTDRLYSGRTNNNGRYSLTVPAGWSGIIRLTLAGYTFMPAERTFTNVLSGFTAENFTASAIQQAITKRKRKKGGGKWLWFALGGAAVAGGVAAVLGGGGNGNGENGKLPTVFLPRPPEPAGN